jgi:hypothetical protein
MSAKPWRDVVKPHRDIRGGRLDESVFAADLGEVTGDRGPVDYRDAETFFNKTYLTRGLSNLMGNVLARLSGKPLGEGVIQLQTPFGGGKTHALIALFHIARSHKAISHLEMVKRLYRDFKLDGAPKVKVGVFVGTEADPLKGRTPWGEIAHQLGKYDLVKQHDKIRVSPGKDLLRRILEPSQPVLLLIDELAEYAVRAARVDAGEKRTEGTLKGQILSFLQELTEVVASLGRGVAVVTLPTSTQQFDTVTIQTLDQLQAISGRVETIYTPVEGEEIYEIVRRRLFEDLGSKDAHKVTAEEYFSLYQHLGEDVPSEMRSVQYRDKIVKAYPFHPDVIDILFERWSTYSTFQRTRGALRFLASVIADLYKRESTAPLIQPSHINLENPTIRRELIKHIGNEFEGVVASDLAGDTAKAPEIDREMGTEYAQFRVASGLATSIFFYSFSGGERKDVSLQRLRMAFLREGIPPAIVGDAVKRLEEELWFLHVSDSTYSFRNQANLTKVILDKETIIDELEIDKEIEKRIDSMCGPEFRVFRWPHSSADIPDNKELKLVLLSPKHSVQNKESKDHLNQLWAKTSSGFRIYKNTLLFLISDPGEFDLLRKSVRRFMALRKIVEDSDFMKTVTEEGKRSLDGKIKDADMTAPTRILYAYRYMAKGSADGIEIQDMGIPAVGGKATLTRRVKDYLREKEMLLDRISPRYILDKVFGKTEDKKIVQEIWEAFLRISDLPMLDSPEVLKMAIVEGVRSKALGMQTNDTLYYGDYIGDTAVSDDAYVVRKILAQKVLTEKQVTSQAQPGQFGSPSTPVTEEGQQVQTGSSVPVGTMRDAKVSSLHIRMVVPWDKLSSFVSGVITPLRSEASMIGLEIMLDVNAPEGIKKETLDLKVRETLTQIGAKIVEWREE